MNITPDIDDLGQRLDRYMRKIFPGAKLGEIYESLRTKKITIGGKKLPENTRLRAGDVIEVNVPGSLLKMWQTTLDDICAAKKPQTQLDPARILYEDEAILVYDKPSGLIVHSPDHRTDEVSLIEQIDTYLREKGWQPTGTFQHPALAHRIDRDTSGIIITCLTRKSYEHMADLFRTRKITKTYHALVMGAPNPATGTITAPLLRIDTGRTDEAKMVVDSQGDPAETQYRVIASGKNTDWSLIELHPKTGRTHQIRIHMAHIGHPLIGDKRYGGRSVVSFFDLSKLYGRRGHLLHAVGISFMHPDGYVKNIQTDSIFDVGNMSPHQTVS